MTGKAPLGGFGGKISLMRQPQYFPPGTVDIYQLILKEG